MTTQAEKAFEEWAESKGIKPNGNAQKMTYKLMKVAWSAAWQQATEARTEDQQEIWDKLLDGLSEMGVPFSHLMDHSTDGEIAPGGKYQWEAVAMLRVGDDDPYSGLGWTPLEAMQSLHKNVAAAIRQLKGEEAK